MAVDASGRERSWASIAFFNFLSFLVAHMFLAPLLLGALAWWVVRSWGTLGAVVVALCLAAYAPIFFDRGERTGKWFSPIFSGTFWTGCHGYFPVKTLMPLPRGGAGGAGSSASASGPSSGAGAVPGGTEPRWADEPCDEHRRTYDVATRTYIFAAYPHGAIPVSAAVLRPQIARWGWLSEKLRVGVADAVFWLPFVREFYLAFGSLSARWSTMVGQLRAGNSVLLLPGGIREQLTVCAPGEDVVVLSKRKGFIKLALETGSAVVPVYFFGERRGYLVQRLLTRWVSRLIKRVFNAGVPIVRGRWFTLMPFPTPITLVFGEPIDVPPEFRGAAPAAAAVARPAAGSPEFEAAVDALHARFTEALCALYERHKVACGYGDVKLVVK